MADNSYKNYRCAHCRASKTLPERIDHKCKKCGTKLIRVTAEAKRFERAKFELRELGE